MIIGKWQLLINLNIITIVGEFLLSRMFYSTWQFRNLNCLFKTRQFRLQWTRLGLVGHYSILQRLGRAVHIIHTLKYKWSGMMLIIFVWDIADCIQRNHTEAAVINRGRLGAKKATAVKKVSEYADGMGRDAQNFYFLILFIGRKSVECMHIFTPQKGFVRQRGERESVCSYAQRHTWRNTSRHRHHIYNSEPLGNEAYSIINIYWMRTNFRQSSEPHSPAMKPAMQLIQAGKQWERANE